MEDNTIFRQEWEKMLCGEIYDAQNPGFHKKLMDTRMALHEYNSLPPDQEKRMRHILHMILGSHGEHMLINQPFRCDYGCNIYIGENFFANFNLTVLDEAEVRIGSNVFIGPNVSILTACHPTEPDERRDGRQWAEPVTIGNDVWIGSNTVILPGAVIGAGCTVGAGSVVRGTLPPRSVAAGCPARVVRALT